MDLTELLQKLIEALLGGSGSGTSLLLIVGLIMLMMFFPKPATASQKKQQRLGADFQMAKRLGLDTSKVQEAADDTTNGGILDWITQHPMILIIGMFVLVMMLSGGSCGLLGAKKAEGAATGAIVPKDLKQRAIDQHEKAKPALRALTASRAASRVKTPDPTVAAFDWATRGGVTPVRDQANCGSCWAFGSCAVAEAAELILTKVQLDLSEQDLVSCCKPCGTCRGGWFELDQITDKGIALEKDFHYTARDSKCKTGLKRVFPLAGWSYVAYDGGIPRDVDLKKAICEHGPVGVCVRANAALSSWKPSAAPWQSPWGSTNHIVTVTGWDDGKRAWRVKNSWGSKWGDKGYFWCAFGSNIGEGACFGIAQPL